MEPLSVHGVGNPYFWLLMIGFAVLLFSFVKKPRETIDFIPALPFAFLPFLSNRHALPAVMVMVPIICKKIQGVVFDLESRNCSEVISETPAETASAEEIPWSSAPRSKEIFTVLSFLLFPGFFLIFGGNLNNSRPAKPVLFPREPAFWTEGRKSPYPEGALYFLEKNGISGNIFCPESWGNFVSFYLQPSISNFSRRPFIHGMGQTYPDQLMKDYLLILNDLTLRNRIIADYGIEIFLLPISKTGEPNEGWHLSRYLAGNKEWRLIYWDDFSYMYIRHDLLRGGTAFPDYSLIDPAGFFIEPAMFRKLASSSAFLEQLSEAVKTPEGSTVVCTNSWLAEVLEMNGRIDDSLKIRERLQAARPDDFLANYNLGMAYARIGKASDSLVFLEAARQIQYWNPLVLFNLAVSYFNRKEIEKGFELLDKCLTASPTFEPAVKLKALLESSGFE